MRVLLTNDDGIDAAGLRALRAELVRVDDVELAVVAPDSNRSAVARGITTRRPIKVATVDFGDGTTGHAIDGTPVDCVRMAALGLVEGFEPELIVSGINHGANLGDDVTYSGTVAAAMEGIILGLPAIAVSQQSAAREMDFRPGETFAFDHAARFAARVVERIADLPLAPATLLNINAPAGEPGGVDVARLGRRIYHDRLESLGRDEDGRETYAFYGDAPGYDEQAGTDLAAVAAGRIAVTPLHLDLTFHDGLGPLDGAQLARLLQPAAEEIAE